LIWGWRHLQKTLKNAQIPPSIEFPVPHILKTATFPVCRKKGKKGVVTRDFYYNAYMGLWKCSLRIVLSKSAKRAQKECKEEKIVTLKPFPTTSCAIAMKVLPYRRGLCNHLIVYEKVFWSFCHKWQSIMFFVLKLLRLKNKLKTLCPF